MKVIKCINNNVAICIDNDNNEVVAFGKGIGFKKPPHEVELSNIERTFYDVDDVYISMINSLPEEVMKVSLQIIDKSAKIIDKQLSANVVITLADHINFSIERYKKNMQIALPIVYDVQHLFQKEYEIGKYGIELIKKNLNVWLPNDEAAYIALHIINAEEQAKNEKIINDNELILDIANIIENNFKILIDKENFNYSRFVSHMQYLFKRGKSKHLIQSNNDKLFVTMITDYPKTYECEEEINKYLKSKIKIDLTDEEKLYLMLHINRLCSREDCYR